MKSLVLIPILFLMACGQTQQQLSSESEEQEKFDTCYDNVLTSNTPNDIQVFGDSHASGFAAYDPSARCGLTSGYAIPLSQMAHRPLDNKAIGGTEITSQLYMVQTYGTRNTAVKVLMAGFNDVTFSTPMDTFKTDLTEIIIIMSQYSDHVYIGTPPYYISKFPHSVTDQYAQAVRDTVSSLNLNNVTLVDITKNFTPDSTTQAVDNIHFNTVGSGEIASLFFANF